MKNLSGSCIRGLETFVYFSENFQDYKYCAPPLKSVYLLGLFNNTTLNSAVPSHYSTATRIRELNYLWELEKADFSKWNILMLIALPNNNLLGVHLVYYCRQNLLDARLFL